MAAGGGHAVQGVVVVVEEQVVFSFDALCRALDAGADEVQALVAEGLLEPAGHGPEDWRFGGAALARARTALRLARELDLGLAGAALVMDLLAEIEALRSRLRPG